MTVNYFIRLVEKYGWICKGEGAQGCKDSTIGVVDEMFGWFNRRSMSERVSNTGTIGSPDIWTGFATITRAFDRGRIERIGTAQCARRSISAHSYCCSLKESAGQIWGCGVSSGKLLWLY